MILNERCGLAPCYSKSIAGNTVYKANFLIDSNEASRNKGPSIDNLHRGV